MNAEELIARAAARGVDLLQAARQGVPPQSSDVAGSRVVMQEFMGGRRAPVLVEPNRNMARGTGTRTFVPPAWTVSEIGLASKGLSKAQFSAALFAFARYHQSYATVFRFLHVEAAKLMLREEWPIQITAENGGKYDYLERLVHLVLLEDMYRPEQFFVAVPNLYAYWMEVTEEAWRRIVSWRFEAVKYEWLAWLHDAARIVQSALNDGDDE